MKQSYLWFWMFAMVWLLISGCNEDESPSITIPFVEQEFVLDLWEEIDPVTGRSLEFVISTVGDEQCLNSTILSGSNVENQTLTVTLYDILAPENCQPGAAPATGRQQVSDIETSQAYVFNVALEDVVTNTGELVINTSSYEVRMSAANGINWVHTVLRKVPEEALWGFITYTTDEQLQIAQDWVDELGGLAQPLELSSGYYGYFSVDDSNPSINIADTPEGQQMLTFVYQYDGQVSALDNSVSDLEANLPDEMIYRLRDGKGNEW